MRDLTKTNASSSNKMSGQAPHFSHTTFIRHLKACTEKFSAFKKRLTARRIMIVP